MSWIQRHWEPEYIDDAEEKIRRTVSCFILHVTPSPRSGHADCGFKMLEYRENATTGMAPSASGGSSAATATAVPQYMSLAEQYGIGDEMEIGGSDGVDQTIEQEYQSYVTAALSPKTIDIIKFWEVGHNILVTYDSQILSTICTKS
jgi:hypothetical protein